MTETIKALDRDDVAEFKELAIRTFEQTYSDQIRREDLYQFYSENFSNDQIEKGVNAGAIHVLEIEGEMKGYTWCESNAPPPPGVGFYEPRELVRLYLDLDARGSGHGRRLLEHAEHEARAEGCDALWLKVWDQNPSAVRFYRALGYEEFGECRFMCGLLPCRDLLMSRALKEVDLEPVPAASLDG